MCVIVTVFAHVGTGTRVLWVSASRGQRTRINHLKYAGEETGGTFTCFISLLLSVGTRGWDENGKQRG